MSVSPRNVLLIGYDEHLCLSILYCLRKEKHYNFFLLTHKPNTSGGASRYVKDHKIYRDYPDLRAAIINCQKEWEIDLIMPFGENEGLEVAKIKEELELLCRVMPLTDLKHLRIATHKTKLHKFLLEKGLNLMPATLSLDEAGFESKLSTFPFPAVLKPAQGAFGRGIYTMVSHSEAKEYIAKHKSDLDNYYLQQYVAGSDINCNVICKEGELQHYSIQESPNKEIGNYNRNDDLQFKDDPDIIELVSPMLAALNYEGVACIDLRRDRKDGKLYLLEINARFWGSVMASYRLANVNFPLFMLKLSFGESVPDYKKTEGRQMALGTFSNEYFRFKFPDLEMLKFWPYFNDPIARFQYFWRKRF